MYFNIFLKNNLIKKLQDKIQNFSRYNNFLVFKNRIFYNNHNYLKNLIKRSFYGINNNLDSHISKLFDNLRKNQKKN